ncbi:hypothetical protein D3C72_2142600 [compost metagenome]
MNELPSGRLLIPSLEQTKVMIKIPNGLPSSKPRLIPSPIGATNPVSISLSMLILVLANANKGIIKKLTGLTSACSRRSKGDSRSVSLVGMVMATITPAIVACIPE